MEARGRDPELYGPLDKNLQEIRLLVVEDGTSSAEITCRLTTVSLNDKPQFTALSYVWGNPAVTENIRVNGQSLRVTVSLASALRSVKFHWSRAFPDRNSQSFRLWADAICINQADLGERSQQVQLMERVYEDADLVFSWLCNETAETKLAMESIRTVAIPILQSSDVEQEPHVVLDWMMHHPALYQADCGDFNAFHDGNKAWKSVASFLNLQYWKRVWIFQELVLSRRCLLASGDASLEWDELQVVCEFVNSLARVSQRGRITKPDRMSFSTWHAITSNVWCPWGQIFNLSTARTFIHKRVDYAAQIQRWISACDNTLLLEATDPKDHVYALLSLCRPLELITPDYSDHKSVGLVYVEFINAWLETIRRKDADGVSIKWTQELYFLMSAGKCLGGEEKQIPSWVPDFSVSPSSDGHKIGRGSRNKSLFNFDTEVAGIIDTSLFAMGIKLGSISGVTEKLLELSNTVTTEAAGLHHYIQSFCTRHPIYMTGIPSLQAVLRVLSTADPDASDNDALGLAMMALWVLCTDNRGRGDLKKLKFLGLDASSEAEMRELLQTKVSAGFDRVQGGEIFLRGVLGRNLESPTMEKWPEDKWQQYLVHTVHSDSRRILELSTNYIGLAPGDTAVGDTVCVLKGCPMPVVLRRVNDYYIHIGTCYILGLESKVGRAYMEQCAVNLELFELR